MRKSIFEYNINNIKEKKIYIYGYGKDAKKLAICLLNQDIYFEGFCTEDYRGEQQGKLYNKVVISLDSCKKNKDIVIIAPYIKYSQTKETLQKYNLEEKLVNFENLRNEVKDVVVYGTGERARKIYTHLKEIINIVAFSDSSREKWGKDFNGITIVSPEELKDKYIDTTIIIGSTAYDEISNYLIELGLDSRRFFYEEYVLKFSYNLEHFLGDSDIYALGHICRDRKVIVYCQEDEAEKIALKFALLDIVIFKLIERKAQKEDGSIYQLLSYKGLDPIFIIVDNDDALSIKMIRDMGFNLADVYSLKSGISSYYGLDYKESIKTVLDPNLGYADVNENSDCPGFVKFEYLAERSKDKVYTVLTLGGSTTSAYGVRNKSWSECLSEIMKKNGISHIIYCGGTQSYQASQELIKLLRDGILLKPDLIISYSGVNNTEKCLVKGFPFLHPYQKILFESYVNNSVTKVKQVTMLSAKKAVNYGIKREAYDAFLEWLNYEKMMWAICKEFGIKFKCFLQPMAFSKKKYSGLDFDLLLQFGVLWDGNKMINRDNISEIEFQKKFRESSTDELCMKYEWYNDLSDVFDEVEDVYMDNCHVYEKGNKIIADRIYKIIEEDIKAKEK